MHYASGYSTTTFLKKNFVLKIQYMKIALDNFSSHLILVPK